MIASSCSSVAPIALLVALGVEVVLVVDELVPLMKILLLEELVALAVVVIKGEGRSAAMTSASMSSKSSSAI
jgi:hypothetical protein